MYTRPTSVVWGVAVGPCFSLIQSRYAVEGYGPLQSPPGMDIVRTDMLLGYVEKLLYIDMETSQVGYNRWIY